MSGTGHLDINPADRARLLASATAYAAGRRTYVVGAVSDVVAANAGRLDAAVRETLADAIRPAADAGDSIDAPAWTRALAALETAAPMPRTDRLMWLKEQFDKGAEWCRSTLHDEQAAKDTEDMAERYMCVCESCDKYPELDPVSVFEGWLLGEELGSPYETRRQAASHMLSDVRRLDRE